MYVCFYDYDYHCTILELNNLKVLKMGPLRPSKGLV